MRSDQITNTGVILEILGKETYEYQSARLQKEGRELLSPDQFRASGGEMDRYDTFVTNVVLGVPGDLPLGRLLALAENLQYVYDLALWVEDPYAFQVPNISSARALRLRKGLRAAYGFEARVNRLHYGSDPVVDFLVADIVTHVLPQLLDALHPYVESLFSREPRRVRDAREMRDVAVYGAEAARALLEQAEYEERLTERRERDGKRLRDQKENSKRPTTLDSILPDSREGRTEEALRQVEIVKIEISRDVFGG